MGNMVRLGDLFWISQKYNETLNIMNINDTKDNCSSAHTPSCLSLNITFSWGGEVTYML